MSFEPQNEAIDSPRSSDLPQVSESTASSLLPFTLALLVLFVMAYGGWTWWRVRQAEAARSLAIPHDYVGPPLTDFELTERSGQPFRSTDMRGRVWVVTYFFTTCPGSCLQLNRNIQLLHNMPELKDVTWVSITCDPDTDTLDELRKYADRFNADPQRWLFCRADLDYTKRVAKGMKLFLGRRGHQDYAIVMDKAGNMRGVFDATLKSDCQQLHALLVKLLAEQPPHDASARSDHLKNRSHGIVRRAEDA
jgi:cytochrome oxidase Cu insertion factor (SCO1/SenC/PrrC family)